MGTFGQLCDKEPAKCAYRVEVIGGHVPEPSLFESVANLRAAIAAKVTVPRIERPEEGLMSRNQNAQVAAGPKQRGCDPKCPRIVFDVLQHVAKKDRVEKAPGPVQGFQRSAES